MIDRDSSRRVRTTLVPDPSAPVTTARPACLNISADTVIAGITFHLLDRNLASDVDAQASHHTLCRLKRQRFGATVTRATWESMSNAERLQWLLAVSDTAYTLRSDNVAVLKRRTR